VSNLNEPKYIYSYQKDNTIVTNSYFNKFWKSDLIKSDIDFNFDLEKNMLSLFDYIPINTKDIDVIVYSLINTPIKLKTTTVDYFPDLLRRASHKFPLFPRIDDKGNSGIYDFQEGKYLLEKFKFVDVGNISINSSDGLNQLYLVIKDIFERKLKFLTIGGDHATTFYNLNSINQITSKKPILIQFDAHQDVGKHELNNKDIHQGNFISHLLENDIVTHVIQVGIRGIRSRNQVAISEKITVINNNEWEAFDKSFINRLTDLYNTYDVYISIDIDVLDPLEFCFVDFPIRGGLNTNQLLTKVKQIFKSKSNIMGLDIVEVNGDGNIDNNDYDLIIYILIYLMNEFKKRSD